MKKKSQHLITTVIFEPVDTISEQLSDFLDSYFEVSAINFSDDGSEEFVGYTEFFDDQKFQKDALSAGILLPAYKIEKLEDQNWLEKNAEHFAPFETKDFCVYGDFETSPLETKKIPLQIYAVAAFGSTHPTTVMCLDAFSDLCLKGVQPHRVLDLGTGSGILAIAAAKKLKKIKPEIYAVDIDPQSVRVAKKNALDNGVDKKIKIIKGNGFKLQSDASEPYDLIEANIFARPLISMARDFAKYTRNGGYAILSGFLKEQKDWVLQAFEKYAFKTIRIYEKNNWVAVILQKKEKLSDFQAFLQKNEAMIVCRNNMFLGEDVLEAENKILELTGFTGSAGLVVIGANKTWLLVDGRYAIQARSEAVEGVEVVDSTSFFKDAIKLCNLNKISQIKLNPWAVSKEQFEFLNNSGLQVVLDENVPMSSFESEENVFQLLLRFAGQSKKEKCLKAAKLIKGQNQALLIAAPDVLSWMANLRSNDLENTPVLRSYGLLNANGRLRIYAVSKIKNLMREMKKYEEILADSLQTPVAFFEKTGQMKAVSFEKILADKLEKNQTELSGFQKAHIKDGVALVRFFKSLEENYVGVSELEMVQKLHDIRALGKNYLSESFGTIAAIDEHGAIVHYEPNVKTNKKMKKNALLLLDSGAQYFDGTTDVTRTVAFGRVNDEVKKDFTLVLKAHIALASHVFEEGVRANVLDSLCRNVLQKYGKDFKHGTGHSVGHFSDVHEAPFSINPRCEIPVKAGYVTSIEPGYYLENKYGIRIENLYFTKKVDGKLCFEALTMFPIDLKLVLPDLLNIQEKKWLNDYHQKVYQTLSPFLRKDERLWLEKKCRAVM